MDELKAVTLFKNLSDAMIAEFAGYFTRTDYAEGTVIFREKSLGESLYIIVDGEVTIEKALDEEGKEFKALAILSTGDFFGEMSMIEDQTRFAQARASKDSALYEIERGKFFSFIKEHPDTGITVFTGIVKTQLKRLQHTSNELTMLFDLSRQLMVEHKSPNDFLAKIMEEMKPYFEGSWNVDAFSYNMFNDEFENVYSREAFAQDAEARKLPSRPESGWLTDQTYLMVCREGRRVLACVLFSKSEAVSPLEKNNLATIFNTISSIVGSAMVNIEHHAEAAMMAKLKQAKG